MLAKIRRRYFWPGMGADVRHWTASCDDCAARITQRQKRAKMKKYQFGAPMERVALDIMGPLPKTTRGNKYVLVIGDYFTKWIEAYFMPNQEAQTVADILTREFIARYGAPMEIHSDQGRNFESAIFQDVCKILGVKKTRTTAFHPQSDGFIERFNRTLQQMLIQYVNAGQTDWDKAVPLVLAAYRATPQETTGQSPNMLMFGREINMPVDLIAGVPPGEEPAEATEYGQELRDRLTRLYQAVRLKTGKEMNRQKRLYDRGKTEDRFKAGDLVWQRTTVRTKGKSPKLQKKWRGPHMIVERYSDVTYLVAESAVKSPKVVHYDRLKKYQGNKRPVWMRKYQRPAPEEPHGQSGDDEYSSTSDSE